MNIRDMKYMLTFHLDHKSASCRRAVPEVWVKGCAGDVMCAKREAVLGLFPERGADERCDFSLGRAEHDGRPLHLGQGFACRYLNVVRTQFDHRRDDLCRQTTSQPFQQN